jgi:uncharacterized membrane protein
MKKNLHYLWLGIKAATVPFLIAIAISLVVGIPVVALIVVLSYIIPGWLFTAILAAAVVWAIVACLIDAGKGAKRNGL